MLSNCICFGLVQCSQGEAGVGGGKWQIPSVSGAVGGLRLASFLGLNCRLPDSSIWAHSWHLGSVALRSPPGTGASRCEQVGRKTSVEEGGHRDNCITCLTRVLEEPGNLNKGREGSLLLSPKLSSAAGLRKNKLRKINQPRLGREVSQSDP